MIYPFKCKGCGVPVTFTCSYEELVGMNKICICCNAELVRDWQAGKPRVHADSYAKAIHSDSLAIHPEQVEEHKRLYPAIPIDEKCRLVFDNFRDHDAYLEKSGHVKIPGKRKRISISAST